MESGADHLQGAGRCGNRRCLEAGCFWTRLEEGPRAAVVSATRRPERRGESPLPRPAQVLLSICSLLTDPNPDDPLNKHAAKMMDADPNGFARAADSTEPSVSENHPTTISCNSA